MSEATGLRIGTAPDSWGVWFPDDPKQVPWQRFLDEVAEAGYHWIELGPYGYLPTDPEQLRDELAKRDLELSGGTVFTHFHREDDDAWDDARGQVEQVAALTAALGGQHIVVIPALWRSDATGEALEPRTLSDEQWRRLASGHDQLGRLLLEQYGLHQQFHSHADSHIGTSAEVERLLAETDPRYTNLCLDTGHFAYYLGDSLALIRNHPERIGYLHLKQVDPQLRAAALKNDTPFATAVQQGIMVEPPLGEPELAPIIDVVADLDPSTFAVVEQDMYPVASFDEPLKIAVRTREQIFATSSRARIR
ncbi:sugar phosphate isomerase/epimerase [Quadrisphaera sp. DSM 44207]|uniref:sugar phosphate isomerase/epimerase family protein n=1 Tax=Quadrisphaera sp. DSM 44207 TaxID=1881057 RepID=UPI0008914A1D|nr:sugar phosphate isomerase/epimerase [Quadrisphaera sp. DSM 44207]SDQ21557.1 2-keto-myo-inositol dehydratase [Quadrisphaera sp. DSM 44207]